MQQVVGGRIDEFYCDVTNVERCGLQRHRRGSGFTLVAVAVALPLILACPWDGIGVLGCDSCLQAGREVGECRCGH